MRQKQLPKTPQKASPGNVTATPAQTRIAPHANLGQRQPNRLIAQRQNMCTFFWCHVLCPCPYEKDCAMARNRIVFWDGMWRHKTAKQAPVPNSGTTCEKRKERFGQDAAPDWKCPSRDLLAWMVELTYVVDTKPCAECRHKCKARFDKRTEEEKSAEGGEGDIPQ